jgi:hypothetical protein
MDFRSPRLAVLAFLAAPVAGCNKPEIESYTVPKPPAVEVQRMVAAILPQGNNVWYFRLTGPADDVEPQEATFDRFVGSVKFKGDDIAFEKPEGWAEEGRTEFRYATLRKGRLELRISRLPNMGEAAAPLPNVNRWRRELGLGPLTEAELKAEAREVKADGATGVRVAMTGRTGGGGGMGQTPPFAGKSRPAEGGAAPVKYTTPDGWEDLGGRSSGGIRMAAAFRAPGGVEVTVIPLPGAAGGLADNVNRWRRQIGLPELSAEQVTKDLREVEVAGARGHLADLAGAAGAKSTVGAIVPRGGTTWFFKMTGPADAVAGQKAAFETFLKSVRFDGA